MREHTTRRSPTITHEREDSLAERVVRTLFDRDRASQALGIGILEVRPGYIRASMPVRPDMVNGHDTCHGGYIFTLADSAFAFCCNSFNAVTVASGATIDFLRPRAPAIGSSPQPGNCGARGGRACTKLKSPTRTARPSPRFAGARTN